jgi:2-dehydropantoate 2-reductase
MAQPLRHAILGPGGIGGLMGACLARIGAPVTMVVRPEALAGYPEQLHLESPFGNVDAPVSRASQVPACDVLWITVKATQLENALRSLTNAESVRAIVPLLNGIDHLALLRERYGASRVIAATIAVESERMAPGRFVHRSAFARLNVSSAGRELLSSTLDNLQKLGFQCQFVDDEPTLMWSKLVFLAPIALATTAAGVPIGGVMSDPKRKEQWQSCVRETAAIATAEGAKVDPEFVISGVLKMPGHMRSSMQKDVEQGNPPELDAIAGPILRGARRHGIPVPATQALVTAVEEKSSSVRKA